MPSAVTLPSEFIFLLSFSALQLPICFIIFSGKFHWSGVFFSLFLFFGIFVAVVSTWHPQNPKPRTKIFNKLLSLPL